LKTLRWENDRELLASAVAGNSMAAAELVLILSNDAIALAWRIMGTMQDAEEVVQEAFLKLWKNHQHFHGDAKIKTYFYTIVQRQCFDQLKKNQKQWNQVDIELDTIISDESFEESNVEEANKMKSAIHILPPKQRIAIVMWAYYDNTAEEIATKLDMNKNAVDQLLFRAKANLKKYFESKHHAR
jgi:RNA polymerase sigma-70 factor (ECF subfamily)